jgi:hypothetical protein
MKLADMPSCPGGGGSGKTACVDQNVANYSVKVRILPLQLQAKA